MIDISKIKPGDTIIVKLVVDSQCQAIDGKTIRTIPSGPNSTSYFHMIDVNAIVGHKPKPAEIKVGTTFQTTELKWTVGAIFREKALCYLNEEEPIIFSFDDIRQCLTNPRSVLNYLDRG